MSNQALNPKELILEAEASNFLGLFRVSLHQVTPHPLQRAICRSWVEQLTEHFSEVGLDRAAHPVKVILEDDSDAESLVQLAARDPHTIQEAAGTIKVLVFDGQHRLAACGLAKDAEEKWWYARVYRQALQGDHPAEFLSLMYSANETAIRRSAQDIDRFLGVHRLLLLLNENRISQASFNMNKSRVMGGEDGARRGVSNLTKSSTLSQAVADALKYPEIAESFSASSWIKITAGRFYDLVAWLLDEMVTQVLLVKGDSHDTTTAPFQLSARACHWNSLEPALQSSAHCWNQLAGGAGAAFSRVQAPPLGFSTPLTRAKGGKWTFDEVVFLPSVLTSQVVTTPLAEMSRIAQHMIHIIAGSKTLASYCGPQGASSEQSHPVGIIYKVLGSRAQKPDGSLSNYPHKIILYMWCNRQELLQDLGEADLNRAVDATAAEYQALVTSSRWWWSLLRLFKMSQFPSGLGVTIPDNFGIQVDTSEKELSRQESRVSIMRRPPMSQTSTPAAMSEEPQEDEMDVDPSIAGGQVHGGIPMSITNQLAAGAGAQDEAHTLDLGASQIVAATPAALSRTKTSRAKRVRDSDGSEDEDYRARLGAREVSNLTEAVEGDHVRTHRSLNTHVAQLVARASTWNRIQSAAVAELLRNLNAVESNLVGEVAVQLAHKIPRITQRARRVVNAQYEHEGHDDGHSQHTPVEGPSQTSDRGDTASLIGSTGEAPGESDGESNKDGGEGTVDSTEC